MDFYAPYGSTKEILAPSGGVVVRGCSVGNATFLTFNSDYGDTLRFVHMRADTTGLNSTNDSRRVNQGDVLGKVLDRGNYDTSTCSLTTEDTHVHFSWTPNNCPINIEGYIFDCEGMNMCPGTYVVNCNRKYQNLSLLSTNGIDLSDSKCNELKNKDWKIGNISDEVKHLQVCLRNQKLYDNPNGYNGIMNEYTLSQLIKWKNQTFGPKWQPKTTLNLINKAKAIVNYNYENGVPLLTKLDQNGNFDSTLTLPTIGLDWQIMNSNEFNNSGISQLLWRNLNDGSNIVWQFDNYGRKIQSVILRNVPINEGWFIAGTGDFNKDQIGDIIWRNYLTGATHIWILDSNSNYSRSVILSNVRENEWSIADIKDVNNDQISDILWRNKINGDNHIWIIDKNSKRKESKILRSVPINSGWNIVGLGDFDNDKYGDVLWRNNSNGDNHIWKLNSNQEYQKSFILPIVRGNNDPNSYWQSKFINDFNSDGNDDILWRGKSNNQTHIWKIDKNTQKINPSIELPVLIGTN
jgi:hypothetical protein